MSRPSTITEELTDFICAEIADGKSLRKICSSADMPHRITVIRWLDAHADFATKYARARELQADFLEEEMSDIEDRTLTGEIDPAAARAVLGSKQWRASKLKPKKYGNTLAIGGSDELPPLKTMDDADLNARIAALMAANADANAG